MAANAAQDRVRALTEGDASRDVAAVPPNRTSDRRASASAEPIGMRATRTQTTRTRSRENNVKKVHFVGASLLALAVAGPALAQDQTPPPPARLDRRGDHRHRDQARTDPAGRADLGGRHGPEDHRTAQIRDLIDLQSVVPSLKVAQFNAAGQTNFIIRGFGNGNGNDGIESSVGVFIDGVYRSRSASALDDLPEIERIEVLRGPQSTLFGKNVSAGAISIVTKQPQFDFGGKAEVSLGNYNQRLQSRARSPARSATPSPCACRAASTSVTAMRPMSPPATTSTTATAGRSAATCCGSRPTDLGPRHRRLQQDHRSLLRA
jgi:hypothetical protein